MKEQEFKDSRSLKYVFTPDELSEISTTLANKTQELRSLEDEKKSISSDYGSRINVSKEEINQAANKVASGYELKTVECIVEYHIPREGEKTLTRKDIEESREGMRKSWVEKMSPMDYNLFNQYQEENAEEVEEKEESTDAAPNPDERIESSREGDITEVKIEENPESVAEKQPTETF